MKIIFSQLFKFSFFKYILVYFKNVNIKKLNHVIQYWAKLNVPYKVKNTKKIVLVECLEEVNPRIESYYKLVPMLSKLYNIKVIALTSFHSYNSTVSFLSNYHSIDKIESIYSFFDIFIKIKALKILLKHMPFEYHVNDGYKLMVNDVNIGDLVYDEYLRIGKKETLKKTNLLFYIISFNAIYSHLKYDIIINSNNITDIISVRDTYSHSSYCRAARNLNNIVIWKNRAGVLSSIRKLKAFSDYNHKSLYFEMKHLEYIKNNYTKDEINSKYYKLIDDRTNGNVDTTDAREVKLAHAGTKITTVSEFQKSFSYDKSKKTVIIYGHIFVDAVRYPHSVIFSDYYTWLTETLLYLIKNKDVNIFVKPHPSEILYDLGKSVTNVIEEFNIKYGSKLVLLNEKIASNILYEISDVLITSSGTISLEAPCEGVKVITAGSNSYEQTNGMFRSNSISEYIELLNQLENLPELTEEQILNSRIGFLWYNELQYVKSKINIDLERTKDIDKGLNLINETYKSAIDSDSFPLFERMINDRMN